MSPTNLNFSKLYEELLFKHKNCSDTSFVNFYEQNMECLSFELSELSVDKNKGVQKIILHAYFSDKLFKLGEIKKAELECRKSLSYLQALSPQERENSNLYDLMQFNLVKISYSLNKLKNANKCLLRLLKKYPSSKEYSLWRKKVKHKKRRAILLTTTLIIFVSLSFSYANIPLSVLTIVLFTMLGSVIALLLLSEYKKNNQSLL